MLLNWIQDVNDTEKKKIHLNIVIRLMKKSSGISSARCGFSRKGSEKSTDGKEPSNCAKSDFLQLIRLGILILLLLIQCDCYFTLFDIHLNLI